MIPVQALEEKEDLRPGRKSAGLLLLDLPEPGAENCHAFIGGALAEVKVTRRYSPLRGLNSCSC